ncbi:centriolar and ciliogenesis-associated protein HYLS1 [Anomaloglossus baeobatrachus]|uniref:centriolar and ciliogenesis-associated protein HYLS1 n=1 Tax=Anomaloglossus baeobatrachus TaxID=238106 RepID=UPI003F4F85D6
MSLSSSNAFLSIRSADAPGLHELSSDCSLQSAPLTISEEELRSELSLLGFTSVPQQRLLQFKEDLEYLMRSRATLEGSSGSFENGTDLEEENSSRSVGEWAPPCWEQLPAWTAAASSQECVLKPPAQRDGMDSYTKHTVRVGASAFRQPRPPALTRKVLRRGSDGQAQVCDESLLSAESQLESSVSCEESQAVKSFIRIPPYSLLEQYRQRSDPVGRYQEYKQSWDTLQTSLEKSRKELRWGVRERMMSAPPLPLPRALPMPNSYVIPTEKKRYGLRWAIRHALVNGKMPRGDYC